jgi:hypothetical protein
MERAAALAVGTGVVADDHEKSQRCRTEIARLWHGTGASRVDEVADAASATWEAALGRWQASYPGSHLVRRPAPHTFDAKADAEGWLGRRREEVVSGEWQPPVKVERVAVLTFGAYSTHWLRERALKPRTREGYDHLLGRHRVPVLGRWSSPPSPRAWCAFRP